MSVGTNGGMEEEQLCVATYRLSCSFISVFLSLFLFWLPIHPSCWVILRLFFVCFYTYVGIISSRVQQAGVCACVCALARVFSLLWKIKISNWPSQHCLFKVKVEATHRTSEESVEGSRGFVCYKAMISVTSSAPPPPPPPQVLSKLDRFPD